MYFELAIYNRDVPFEERGEAIVKEEDCREIYDLLLTEFLNTEYLFGDVGRWFVIDTPDEEELFSYFDYDYAWDIANLINDRVKELGYEYAIKWSEYQDGDEETDEIKEIWEEVGSPINFSCYFLSQGWNHKNEYCIWNTDKDKPALSWPTDFNFE